MKPPRTASKSLGRQESLCAVAELQFLLLLGCWARKERLKGLLQIEKKDLCGCFRSFLPLAKEQGLQRG